jgi:hypothetical protein
MLAIVGVVLIRTINLGSDAPRGRGGRRLRNLRGRRLQDALGSKHGYLGKPAGTADDYRDGLSQPDHPSAFILGSYVWSEPRNSGWFLSRGLHYF